MSGGYQTNRPLTSHQLILDMDVFEEAKIDQSLKSLLQQLVSKLCYMKQFKIDCRRRGKSMCLLSFNSGNRVRNPIYNNFEMFCGFFFLLFDLIKNAHSQSNKINNTRLIPKNPAYGRHFFPYFCPMIPKI